MPVGLAPVHHHGIEVGKWTRHQRLLPPVASRHEHQTRRLGADQLPQILHLFDGQLFRPQPDVTQEHDVKTAQFVGGRETA